MWSVLCVGRVFLFVSFYEKVYKYMLLCSLILYPTMGDTVLQELLSRPSDFWVCLKIGYPVGNLQEGAGIVALQRKGGDVYLSRIWASTDDIQRLNTTIQSLYYTILEDVQRVIVDAHVDGIQHLFVEPLYGYGTAPYMESIQHLQKEIVVAPPRVSLTYHVCSVEDKPDPAERTVQFVKVI